MSDSRDKGDSKSADRKDHLMVTPDVSMESKEPFLSNWKKISDELFIRQIYSSADSETISRFEVADLKSQEFFTIVSKSRTEGPLTGLRDRKFAIFNVYEHRLEIFDCKSPQANPITHEFSHDGTFIPRFTLCDQTVIAGSRRVLTQGLRLYSDLCFFNTKTNQFTRCDCRGLINIYKMSDSRFFAHCESEMSHIIDIDGNKIKATPIKSPKADNMCFSPNGRYCAIEIKGETISRPNRYLHERQSSITVYECSENLEFSPVAQFYGSLRDWVGTTLLYAFTNESQHQKIVTSEYQTLLRTFDPTSLDHRTLFELQYKDAVMATGEDSFVHISGSKLTTHTLAPTAALHNEEDIRTVIQEIYEVPKPIAKIITDFHGAFFFAPELLSAPHSIPRSLQIPINNGLRFLEQVNNELNRLLLDYQEMKVEPFKEPVLIQLGILSFVVKEFKSLTHPSEKEVRKMLKKVEKEPELKGMLTSSNIKDWYKKLGNDLIASLTPPRLSLTYRK